MADARGQPGLAPESLARRCVLSVRSAQDFERDGPIEAVVDRRIHDSHRALAQNVDHAIRPKLLWSRRLQ